MDGASCLYPLVLFSLTVGGPLTGTGIGIVPHGDPLATEPTSWHQELVICIFICFLWYKFPGFLSLVAISVHSFGTWQ